MSREGMRKVVSKMAEIMRGESPGKFEKLLDAANPQGLIPCRHCGKMCMETELIKNDWFGRGEVIRITSMCDESADWEDGGDDDEWRETRTEFSPEAKAVAEWNEMNRKEEC